MGAADFAAVMSGAGWGGGSGWRQGMGGRVGGGSGHGRCTGLAGKMTRRARVADRWGRLSAGVGGGGARERAGSVGMGRELGRGEVNKEKGRRDLAQGGKGIWNRF